MNEKYNEAVFQFFTEDEDRFLMMGKIAQHEPKVRKELVESFWTKLQQELAKKFSEEAGWVVRFSNDWNMPSNKLMIYKKSWDFYADEFPLISFSFQHLFFGEQPIMGVFVNRERYTKEGYNITKIMERIRSKKEKLAELGINKEADWFATMQNTLLNLSNYDNLTAILPKNEKDTMENLVKKVGEYIADLEEFMERNNDLIEFKTLGKGND